MLEDPTAIEISREEIDCRVEVSLAYMEEFYPGPWSDEEIAYFCGCSRSKIRKIEHDALDKIREQVIDNV